MPRSTVPHFHVAIAGSGFAGMGMAIRLKQAGIDDFAIFERAFDVGGTWRDNTYPGCACDVQSHLYSFSFAPNPDWSHMYSRQGEIWAYLKRCAAHYGLGPHLRFGHEVTGARWDSPTQRWHLETSQGPFTASVLVAGFGALSEPVIPDIPGLATFAGDVFHSARWDHEVDLAGKRVAVIGTGASAIQFVPAIQPRVGRLTVYQRTPPWILPRQDRAITELEKWLFRALPGTQAIARQLIYLERELYVFGFRDPRVMQLAQAVALRYMEASVPDAALRAKLVPNYAMGCKRILLTNDYLPALTRPNVEVVTARIREVRPHGVVTEDGQLREADALILGTGFAATDPPSARFIRGRDGRTLHETWNGSPKAYAGTTFAGFPNLYMLFGPNTGLGHTSVLLMLESQIAHTLKAIQHMRRSGLEAIEPRAEAEAAYVADVDRLMRGTVWTSGGCRSWYLDATGRNATLWPSFVSRFSDRVEHFDPRDYTSFPPTPAAASATQEVTP